jgi:hypothetical protein
MIINKENYELYAIDYIDGNLSPSQERQMEQFLSKNPAIKKELKGLGLVVISPNEAIVFEGKAALIKKERKALIGWNISILLLLLLIISSVSIIGFQYNATQASQSTEFIATEKTMNLPENIDNQDPIVETDKVIGDDTKPKEAKKASKNTAIITQDKSSAKKTTNSKVGTEYKAPILDTKLPKDSIQNMELDPVKNVDSLMDEAPKVKIQTIPMASISPQLLPRELEEEPVHEFMKVVEYQINRNIGFHNTKPVKKSKSIKTPFGKIQFSELAQAFLPESYIAGK